MAGLTATGYEALSLNDVLNELRDAARAEFGDDINLTSGSVMGTVLGIIAESLSVVWEQSQLLYDAFDKDNATGQQLDNLAQLIGLTRRGAIASTVTLQCASSTGGGGTIAVGDRVSNTSGEVFEAVESGTLPALPEFISLLFRAVDTGVTDVAAGVFDSTAGATIITTVTSWDLLDNTSAGFTGSPEETDAELRVRMDEQTEIVGAATVEAIRADLLELLTDATDVLVLENVLDVDLIIGSLTLLPHSITVVVWPPTVSAVNIAQGIFDNRAAGINTNGAELEVITDSMGIDHDIRFEYAVQYDLEWHCDLSGAPHPDLPGDAEDQIRDLLTDYTRDTLRVGQDINIVTVLCAILATVEGITSIVLGLREKGTIPYTTTGIFPIDVVDKPWVDVPATDIVVVL